MGVFSVSRSKLTDEQAELIRQSYSGAWGDLSNLGREYEVTPQAIRAIVLSHSHPKDRKHVPTPEERFWSKVLIDGPVIVPDLGACSVWTGSSDSSGYGHIWIAGRGNVKAHRFAWELETGEIPQDLVCHKCDFRRCVRFSHLFEGDHQANSDDKIAKGRFRSATLTAEQVLEIRAKYGLGNSLASLGRAYHVSISCIHRIVTRKGWKHI